MRFFFSIALIGLSLGCLPLTSLAQQQRFADEDLTRFWIAYDSITATSDTLAQARLLDQLFLAPATAGLKSLIEVRRYTPEGYLQAIRNYPAFWKSIRHNSQHLESVKAEISKDIAQLKQLYPALKPATIYFLMGVFRTNGTIQEDRVLLGAEMALTDASANTHELPEHLQNYYRLYRPREQVGLLCTHEYIHIQQKQPQDNLLCYTLHEGIAEFISCHATGKPSSLPNFAFGLKEEARIKTRYVQELYLPGVLNNWMWGANTNELGERDLGYFVGYRIAEAYLANEKNKSKAIRELIELDYTNDKAVEKIVDGSRYFPQKISAIYREYEASRPRVINISPFKNKNKKVAPGLTRITVYFSQPLNGYNTGVDYGPLGETAFPTLSNRTWSPDGSSWSFDADLKPGKTYQILLSNNFRLANGVRLKQFLIEFQTLPE
ncbi:MAG TPA: hypothetical protein VK168_15220 [Saprospiraceae bacterium]|nr:hypothetical protein [Saprospiraceae bacterium]